MSNCAFCVSYAESNLTCKFELNTAILDFDRFDVSKKPIFYNSSRKPQMVRFVLVTLKAVLPANFKLYTVSLHFVPFEVVEKPIFHTSSQRPQIVPFMLVTVTED